MTRIEGRMPLRKEGLFLRQANGENAVYDPASGKVHLLNATAWAIWDLCDGETHPDEMIDAICEISRMHRDLVSEDVRRVLGEFESAGLLRWVTQPQVPLA
ncbi:MAG: HPr-rel-A system PqqD family peptide chaperone [Actinomycetota bacterium]